MINENGVTFNIISTSLVDYSVDKAEDASDDGLLDHVIEPSGIGFAPAGDFEMAGQRGRPGCKAMRDFLIIFLKIIQHVHGLDERQ